jgi:hypothetical protein
MEDAQQVFDQMSERNVVAWTAMITRWLWMHEALF